MHSTFDFAGADVVVVGASRAGIGASIARAFQEAGASVEITGAEAEPAPEDATRFAYTQLDVTDGRAVRDFAARHEKVDVLVNCAAITARGEEMAPDFFTHVVNVNLSGTFRMAEAFHGQLKAAKGALINIASMYGAVSPDRRLYDDPAQQSPFHYGPAKAGLLQLTRHLAGELGARRIRVNALVPGPFPAKAAPDFAQRLASRTMLGRLGKADEIAGPLLFLASPAASFVTGAALNVDGGWTAW